MWLLCFTHFWEWETAFGWERWASPTQPTAHTPSLPLTFCCKWPGLKSGNLKRMTLFLTLTLRDSFFNHQLGLAPLEQGLGLRWAPPPGRWGNWKGVAVSCQLCALSLPGHQNPATNKCNMDQNPSVKPVGIKYCGQNLDPSLVLLLSFLTGSIAECKNTGLKLDCLIKTQFSALCFLFYKMN